MSDHSVVEKRLLKKISDVLKRKPEIHDVIFSVGHQKKLVKAVKLILIAASLIFEQEFEEKWDMGLGKEEGGIPLPDLDAEAFELFIELTTLDTWSFSTLANLNLQPEELLNLLSICKRFDIKPGQVNLEKIAKPYIQCCSQPEERNTLLKMNRINFDTILGSDDLCINETKIYETAYDWAGKKCSELKWNKTAENLRSILGDSIYKIRFPLMSNEEFAEVDDSRSLLTPQETRDIYKYIGTQNNQQAMNNATWFSTKPKRHALNSEQRQIPEVSNLCLTNGYQMIHYPPFVCNGSPNGHIFTINQRIAMHALGFLGPLDAHSFYAVTVEILKYINGDWVLIKEETSHIFAKKGKVFHLVFGDPLVLEAYSTDGYRIDYGIRYFLKGPNTVWVERPYAVDKLLTQGSNKFTIQWCSRQLSEILYKNI